MLPPSGSVETDLALTFSLQVEKYHHDVVWLKIHIAGRQISHRDLCGMSFITLVAMAAVQTNIRNRWDMKLSFLHRGNTIYRCVSCVCTKCSLKETTGNIPHWWCYYEEIPWRSRQCAQCFPTSLESHMSFKRLNYFIKQPGTVVFIKDLFSQTSSFLWATTSNIMMTAHSFLPKSKQFCSFHTRDVCVFVRALFTDLTWAISHN